MFGSMHCIKDKSSYPGSLDRNRNTKFREDLTFLILVYTIVQGVGAVQDAREVDMSCFD